MKNNILFCAIFALSFFMVFEPAQALRITLKRVVFEGPKRAEVITLINNKDVPETYRLGWRNLKMTETDSLVEIKDGEPIPPGIKPASDMVVFAPRRFTIPPKSSQQIRMMLRMPANLPDGEYRSHFWVRPEAEVKDIREELLEKRKAAGKGANGVSVKLLAGVTMPVIVRKGNLSATAEIQNLNVTQTPGHIDVSFYLARSGDKSLYGDLDCICNAGSGGEYVLRNSKGNALYTEVNGRQFNLHIIKPQDKPACQNVTVKYLETDKFMGKEMGLLAQASAPVN